MLIVCKLGPTTQHVRGRDYEFQADGSGRFVCEVSDDHLSVFLARSEAYELACPVGGSLEPTVTHSALRTLDGTAVAFPDEDVAVVVENQRPRRGRPMGTGIDDRASLEQLLKLRNAGIGLNNAAALVAASLAPSDTIYQHSVRKRLLRKLREPKSR